MNWMGVSLRALLGAVLGASLGAYLFIRARSVGLDVPPLVGLLAGALTAALSRERSGLRGVVVSTVGVWFAAAAEVWDDPHRGFIGDLAHFHERLAPARFALYLGCAALAMVLASARLRQRGNKR